MGTWNSFSWAQLPVLAIHELLVVVVYTWVNGEVGILAIALQPLIDKSWQIGSHWQFGRVREGLVHDRRILDNLVWLDTRRARDDQLGQRVVKSVRKFLRSETPENH